MTLPPGIGHHAQMRQGYMSPSRLRVLVAILDGPTTIRDILLKIGSTSPNSIKEQLADLEAAGLIAREKGKARTIRPTCKARRA